MNILNKIRDLLTRSNDDKHKLDQLTDVAEFYGAQHIIYSVKITTARSKSIDTNCIIRDVLGYHPVLNTNDIIGYARIASSVQKLFPGLRAIPVWALIVDPRLEYNNTNLIEFLEENIDETLTMHATYFHGQHARISNLRIKYDSDSELYFLCH